MSKNSLTISASGNVTKDVTLNYEKLSKAALILRAINHKLRQSIVKLLEERERLKVTDIYVKLRLEQSVASQHLAILRNAGIVITERDGKYIYYSLNKERISEVIEKIDDLVDSEEN